MAEDFLSLDAQEQGDILRTVAVRSGRPAVILEKDIWVCWALQAAFSIPDHHPMAFKGGTSLAKVYGIIDRFSEDVDITLDYRAFEDDFDPFDPAVSKTRIRRFSDRLKGHVQRYTREVMTPALSAAADRLATAGRHEIHIGDDGETIRFAYPSVIEEPLAYVKSEILLEFGGRNVIDPNEQHDIVPDIAELTPELDYPTASVTVLSPARTFWQIVVSDEPGSALDVSIQAAPPYTELLLAAVPRTARGGRGQRTITPGEPPDLSNLPVGPRLSRALQVRPGHLRRAGAPCRRSMTTTSPAATSRTPSSSRAFARPPRAR